jgi:N-dimethylarginine dimethylaminohydrolase
MKPDLESIDLSRIPGYRKGKPPIRMDDVTFDDELEAMWGRKWGAPSSIGKLKSVLVREIPPENTAVELFRKDPAFFNLSGYNIPGYDVATEELLPANLVEMRRQQRAYTDLLEANGVEVIYADVPDWQHGPYTPLRGGAAPEPVIIRGGAIIPRCALAWKRGLEVVWTKVLANLGCPILYTVHGSGIFEGRVDWIDPTIALLGLGHRSNREGIRQVEPILRMSGVEEIIVVDLPGDFLTHLCMAFVMVDRKLALVHPPAIPYDVLRHLEKKGLNFIEIHPAEVGMFSGNSIALEPGRIITPEGSPRTVERLRASGVEVLEVEWSEIHKGSGGPTCLTMAMEREDGPLLSDP